MEIEFRRIFIYGRLITTEEKLIRSLYILFKNLHHENGEKNDKKK